MLEKLAVFEKRFEELTRKLYDGAVAADPERYTQIMKELRELEPVALKYKEYKNTLEQQQQAKELLHEPGLEKELKEMAEQELAEAKAQADALEEELKILLLPKDPNDDRNVIMEIRGGAGGEEAALFCSVLFRMYSMYAEKRGWKAELVNANQTELGGYKEISFILSGIGAYSRLKFESGVHRVQRVPETESQGRIHTSTVTVAVLPEAEDVEMEINPADLQIDTFRSSGAGGSISIRQNRPSALPIFPPALWLNARMSAANIKTKRKR